LVIQLCDYLILKCIYYSPACFVFLQGITQNCSWIESRFHDSVTRRR